jgi:hypothetical protein
MNSDGKQSVSVVWMILIPEKLTVNASFKHEIAFSVPVLWKFKLSVIAGKKLFESLAAVSASFTFP